MSVIGNLLRKTFFSDTKAEEVKNVQGNQPNFKGNINPNNVSYKDPIVDSFGYSSDRASGLFKNLSTMFLVSFCLFSFPDLLLFGIGAFLFAKHGDTLKESLEQMIKQSSEAFGKLNQQVNANTQTQASAQTQSSQAQAQAQQAAPPQNVSSQNPVTNPQKTEAPVKRAAKQLTPSEKAELKYSKAENNVLKSEVNYRKSIQNADIAVKKFQAAKEKMEKAKHEFETANEENLNSAKAKYEQANTVCRNRYAEAKIASETVNVLKAKLDNARVKLDDAMQNYQKINGDKEAEEIVDISSVPV